MVTGEINKLSEATNNLSTRRTSFSSSTRIRVYRDTMIVPYVGVIGFEDKRKSERKVRNV